MSLKQIFFTLSILFLSLYIPLSFCIYSSFWYEFNFESQNLYEIQNKSWILENTQNLITFFSHKSNLNENWSQIEIIHMLEVRQIYDLLFLLGIFSIIFIVLNNDLWNYKFLKKISKINMLIVSSLIIIFPFFNF